MFKQSEFVAHASVVNCLSIGSYSQKIIATGGDDNVVHIWSSESENIWKLSGHKTPIECVAFNPNEEYLGSGSRSGSIKIFDINEGKVARNLRGHQASTCCLYYHPSADIIVSGSHDTNVKAWDLRNKECLMTCPGHDKEVSCVRFSPDGRWLVTAALDGKIIFWDVVAGKIFNTIKLSGGTYATQLEFSPVELYLAVTTSARTCLIYDCENNFECVVSTPFESSAIRSICYSNRGRCLCTATDSSLRVYELPNNLYYKEVADGAVAEFSCLHTSKIAWDGVTDLRLNESNYLMAGCFNSNFVSLYNCDLSGICGEDGCSPHHESKDHHIPEPSLNEPRYKKVTPSNQQRLTTAQDDKSDESDEFDNYSGYNRGLVNDRYGCRHKGFAAESKEDYRVTPKPNEEAITTPSRPVSTAGSNLQKGRHTPNTPPSVSKSGNRLRNLNTPDSLNNKSDSPFGIHHNVRDMAIVGNRQSDHPHSKPSTPSSMKACAESVDVCGPDQMGLLLDNAIVDGTEFTSNLSHRLSSLRILQQYWNENDMTQVISEIQLMYESNRSLTLRSMQQGNMLNMNPGGLGESNRQMLVHASKQPIMIVADFLMATQGLRPQKHVNANGLSLDMCLNLLPILDNMLNDAALEYVVKASVITIITICDGFGEMISTTRSNMQVLGNNKHGLGVDISREDRVRKCNQSYDILDRVNARLKSIKRIASSSAGQQRKYNNATVSELIKLESKLASIIVL